MQDVLNPRSRVFFRAYSVYQIAANFNLSPRYLYPQALLPFFIWRFFRITATQYLTALALVQDYRRHLAYSSPPPHAHVIYIANNNIPAQL